MLWRVMCRLTSPFSGGAPLLRRRATEANASKPVGACTLSWPYRCNGLLDGWRREFLGATAGLAVGPFISVWILETEVPLTPRLAQQVTNWNSQNL